MGEPIRDREMDFSFLIGAWEVIDSGLETAKGDGQGVTGAMFELTGDGDVSWRLPENHIDIPVFSSDTFEAVARGPFLTTLIRFGSYKGHVIEFRIEKFDHDSQTMTIHEGLLYMICKKMAGSFSDDYIMELPFTLLPAFDEGFFTDLSIVADNKTEFRVQSCILKILAPDIDWQATPTPFSGLPENIINTVIHYLYTYSLPVNLSLEGAQEMIKTASNYPGLDDLISLCQNFIKNVTLAKEMASIITDVQSLCTQATEHFAIRSDVHSIREPAILCNAARNAIRDVAVAISKILLFCDMYNKRKNELSRKGRNEIIRYTKARIPYFVSQVNTFMQVVKATFGSLSASERHELACYLLPEIGNIFDTVINILLRIQEFFETVLLRLGPEDNAKYRLKMHNFNEHMERINHKKEVSKVRFILHRVECLIHHLKKKRERFRSLNSENRVRSLTRNLDHLIDRLPFLFLRLEEITEDLEQKCEWIESQFCFKMTTAKVGEFLSTLLENKEPLQILVTALCDLVQQDEFTQSIIALGVLERPADDIDNLTEGMAACPRSEDITFNLRHFVCDPPPSRANPLCRRALERLKTSMDTDMVLRVIPSEDQDDDEDENKDVGEFTDDDWDSENGQGEANVHVMDAKVEDASTAPVGAEDASSTDRGSVCEVTANPETKGACPNNTGAESACPKNTGEESADPNAKADSAATGDTKIGDVVSTEEQVDGTVRGDGEADNAVIICIGDGGVSGKNGKEDAVSTEKQIDGTARGSSEADDVVTTAKEDGAERTKKDKEDAVSTETQIDGTARGSSEADDVVTTAKEDGGVRAKKDKEDAVSTDEKIDGTARGSSEADDVVPAVKGDGADYGIKGKADPASTGEQIDGTARRSSELKEEVPAVEGDGADRAIKGKADPASNEKEEGAAGAITKEEEGAGSAIIEEKGATCAITEEEEGAGNEIIEEGGATCAITEEDKGAGSAIIEGGATCAITGEEKGAASAIIEERGATCAITEEDKGAGSAIIEEGGAKCAITEEEKGAASAIIEEEGAACAIVEEDGQEIVEDKPKKDVTTYKAHRAIIAARCPLFKKALLSGMQEDINRKIDIHNISPKLFPAFLEFLYTGVMDYSNFSPRQITDMFLVADCYELDSLKQGCERALRICIDDNSVLLFLNMADKYNAPILKESCKRYISEHPTVSLDNMLYDEMPKKLKGEIYDLVVWGKDRASRARTPDPSADGSDEIGACALVETESDTDPWDIRRIDIEDCVPSTNSLRFRWGLEQLREVIGPGVPRTTLVQVLLAADCDVNRALNYYYSTS